MTPPAMTLQDLVDRVRSAARAEAEAEAPSEAAAAPDAAPDLPPPPAPPALPPPLLPPMEGWESSGLRWDEALLAAPDAEWLDLAYRVVLGRASDPAGLAHYRAEQTARGSRYWVIFAMRGSPEGIAQGRPLGALRLPRLLLLAGRIGLKLKLGRFALTPLRRWERRVQKPFRLIGWLRATQDAQHRQLAEFRRQDAETAHRLDLALHSHTLALQSHQARLDDYFKILKGHAFDLVRLKASLEPLTDQAAFQERRVVALADEMDRTKRRHARLIEALAGKGGGPAA